MASNVYRAPFFVPPPVSVAFPRALAPGQIEIYKDANWNSTRLTIDTTGPEYPARAVFSFSGTVLQDTASWIAFNLPEGTVCTLFKNIIRAVRDNPFDFADAGECVDLIGNGQLQTVDLTRYGINDRLSGGIWRKVKASEGWFQMFRDDNCSGVFNTFFLNEWPVATVTSLYKWGLMDQWSSINYPCLTPVQVLTFADNTDGTGAPLSLGAANPFGTHAKIAQLNFSGRGMNNRISSFSYRILAPVKSQIESVSQSILASIAQGNTFQATIKGVNPQSSEVVVALQLAQGQSYTLESTVALEYSMSVGIETSVSASGGLAGIEEVEASVTTSFSTTTTTSTSNTTSSTRTIDIGQEITFTIPAGQSYDATANIAIGQIPPTSVPTSGRFYYDYQLPGSEPEIDPASGRPTGLYVLTSGVSIMLDGGVATAIWITTS